MDYIFIVLWGMEILFMAKMEKSLWGYMYTPVMFLNVPAFCVTILAVVVSHISTDIPDFYLPSISVWMIGSLFFWMPGLILSSLSKNRMKMEVRQGRQDDAYWFIFFLIVLLLVVKFVQIQKAIDVSDRNYISFGTDEFSENLGNKGLTAHLGVLLSTFFMYLIYKIDKSHKSAFILVLLSLVYMYAYGSKGWIIIPFIAGFIARVITGKSKISMNNILLLTFIPIVVFFLSYYLILVVSGGADLVFFLDFIYKHILMYIIGGVLSFSLDFQMGIMEPEMIEQLFAPFVSLYNALIGETGVSPNNIFYIDIGELGSSNVRGFMGTVYIYPHNLFVSIFALLLTGTLCYLTMYMARVSKNIFLILAFCANMAYLIQGYFDYYWLIIGTFEMPIYAMMLSFLIKNKK